MLLEVDGGYGGDSGGAGDDGGYLYWGQMSSGWRTVWFGSILILSIFGENLVADAPRIDISAADATCSCGAWSFQTKQNSILEICIYIWSHI